MSEHSYPLELLRAELKAAMAEQLVNLVDRFVSKRDLADFRADFAAHLKHDEECFAEIKQKLDALRMEKSERDGATNERASKSGRWYVLLAVGATLCGGLVGALGSVAANAFFN